MCPTPCLCRAVSAQRAKAVPGSDQKLLEAIMSKARGSTSTSIKHSDVPMEICHCGWVQTKRKYTPCRFLGQLVSGRGRQLERGVFRHKLAFFFWAEQHLWSKKCPSNSRCLALCPWLSHCISVLNWLSQEESGVGGYLGFREPHQINSFWKNMFCKQWIKIKTHEVTLYLWQPPFLRDIFVLWNRTW